MSAELRGKSGGTGTVLALVAETISCAGLRAQERLGVRQSHELSPYLLGEIFKLKNKNKKTGHLNSRKSLGCGNQGHLDP